MTRIAFAAAVLGLAMAGCAPQEPLTVWPYSAWYMESGGGSLGGFQEQRKQCLQSLGIGDPAAVKPGSDTEAAYIRCMNAALWCSPGAPCP